jgi:hypothetical protein
LLSSLFDVVFERRWRFAVFWDFRGSKFWKVLNCEEESHADAGDIPAVGGEH